MADVTYRLRLGDGSRWLLVATPGTRRWVEDFALIMRLRAVEPDRHREWPRVIFFMRSRGRDEPGGSVDLGGSNMEDTLPRSGWEAHDLRSLRYWSHQAVPDVICELGTGGNHELDIIRMWTSLYIIYLRVQDSGGLPLHAALVEREGRGFLVAGPGGSGKSTLCRGLPPPWRAISDDQSLTVRDDRKRYLAHPIPTWSDYLWRRGATTWKVEYHVPLAALFFIEPTRSDQVVPLGQGKAAVSINYSATEVCRSMWWHLSKEEERKLRQKIFDNCCELAKAVPGYVLRVSLRGRFWEEMERVV